MTQAAFDPKKYIAETEAKASAPQAFDPKAYIAQSEAPQRIKNTKAESAFWGGLQGATLNFADEGEAAIRTGAKAIKDVASFKGLPDLVKTYKAERDPIRARYEAARQDNPEFYTGGEIAGAVGSAFIPGLGWMQAGRNATVGAKLLTAAKAGGIAGAGASTSDLAESPLNAGRLIEDAGTGALYGAVAQGALSGAGKVIKGLTPTNVAKKAANVLMNTPEEITETYIKNPTGVKTAPKRFELAQAIESKGLDVLKKEVTEGSAESRAILRAEGKTLKGTDISRVLNQKANEIARRAEGVMDDPEKIAAYNWLKDTAKKYGSTRDPDTGKMVSKSLSTNRVKDFIQSLDRATEWETGAGKFARIDDSIKKEVRSAIDAKLKKTSPAYVEQMKKVADDTSLLKDVGEVASSQRGWSNVFRKLETDKYGSGQIPAETLKALDRRLKTNFLEQAKLSNAREAFDKSVTNGSRNVNLFSNALKDIPIVRKLAPLIGGTVDKYGRELTMKAVDGAVKLNEVYQRQGAQDFVRAVRPLVDAAKKGNASAVITIQMLSEGNPQAMKYFESQNAMQRKSENK